MHLDKTSMAIMGLAFAKGYFEAQEEAARRSYSILWMCNKQIYRERTFASIEEAAWFAWSTGYAAVVFDAQSGVPEAVWTTEGTESLDSIPPDYRLQWLQRTYG